LLKTIKLLEKTLFKKNKIYDRKLSNAIFLAMSEAVPS